MTFRGRSSVVALPLLLVLLLAGWAPPADAQSTLLYLKVGNPATWTTPGAAGSQAREILLWQSAGYTVTTRDLLTTPITTSLLAGYRVLRLNAAWHLGWAPTSAEALALEGWVRSGGRLLAECPVRTCVPAIARFGVSTIDGANGGSSGLSWTYHGSPWILGPASGPVASVPSLAASSMDRPVLTPGHTWTIDVAVDGNPAVVHGQFGLGRVVIVFLEFWSHDAPYGGHAYNATIYQASNLQFLTNCIQYLSVEPGPGLSIEDRAVAEGNATRASFRVTLSPASTRTVTVNYATADGTATAPLDYTATSGILTFTPGRTIHSIAVPIVTDTTPEGIETFTVKLSSATHATLVRAQATGTIDDPPAPDTVPMYRAYNPNADYHFFTTSLAEFENAVAAGYYDESNPPCCTIPFYVPNTQVTGAAAIFRMYNPNNGRHYYTASAGERDSLKGVGWAYEKDEGFVYTSQQAGTAEVFRLYNSNSGVHLYTANAGEKDAILARFPGVWFQHSSLGFAVDQP